MTTMLFAVFCVAGVAFLLRFLIALFRDQPREACQISRITPAVCPSHERQGRPVRVVSIDGARWSEGGEAAEASFARQARSL
jgi:hypothetical protein